MKLSKRNLPTLLSVFAALGVVGTSVLAVKATPKALNDISQSDAETNKEKFIAAWKNYIPAFLSGAFTIGCIFTANGISKKQQDALLAAYMALNRSYSSYKGKVIERHGIEEHREIMKEITIKNTDKDMAIFAPGIAENSCTDFGIDEDEHLFYDPVGNRYFNSTIGKVLQAEYHLNRKFCMGFKVTMNNFYKFLGLETDPKQENKGWRVGYNGIYWIDFDNYTAKIDDLECMVVEPVFYPSWDYKDWDYFD